MVPVFTAHEGRFAASFLRVLIDRADRAPEAPSLRSDQRRALDVLEEGGSGNRTWGGARQSSKKDLPERLPAERPELGQVAAIPEVGGRYHRDERLTA